MEGSVLEEGIPLESQSGHRHCFPPKWRELLPEPPWIFKVLLRVGKGLLTLSWELMYIFLNSMTPLGLGSGLSA